jgi:hypothetical protein
MTSPSLDSTDPPKQKPLESLALRVSRQFCQHGRNQTIIRRFMAETTMACRAGEATFWVISADGRNMEGAINTGVSRGKIEGASVPANDSVVGLTATTGISACIGPDDYQNPTIINMTGLKVHSMVVAPVRVDAQICGVISAVNPIDGGLFQAADLDVLQWKAYLFGLVLRDIDEGA